MRYEREKEQLQEQVLDLQRQLLVAGAPNDDIREKELEEEVLALKKLVAEQTGTIEVLRSQVEERIHDKEYADALAKVSQVSFDEKKVRLPIPEHLMDASNAGFVLTHDGDLKEDVFNRSAAFLSRCNEWEEKHGKRILDDTVIYSFVEGTATLGWPKKEVYINFYADGDEDIMKYQNGCDGRIIMKKSFLICLYHNPLLIWIVNPSSKVSSLLCPCLLSLNCGW